MRFSLLSICILLAAAAAQNPPGSQQNAGASLVTVPITLDLYRVIIPVEIPLPDGSTAQIQGLVDNGNPGLWISRRVAEMLGLTITCSEQMCTGISTSQPTSLEVQISGMEILLPLTNGIRTPIVNSSVIPGTSIEIILPSRALRHYDVLYDFPGRQLTIGKPGTIHFKGESAKVQINTDNGIVKVPGKIENKKYTFVLNLAASLSWLSDALFENLANAHPDWPHMTGSVGPANLGTPMGPTMKLMRLDRMQFGPLYLTDVPAAEISENQFASLREIAGPQALGIIGSDVLQNYRVGFDYAHSLVYFDIGRTIRFPEFDVVGLTLRPENDARFTVIGIADFEGKPSVPGIQVGDHLIAVGGIPVAGSTIGQAWALLGGAPGQERKLTLERNGKQFDVIANVRRFLGVAPDANDRK
jgi:hypothetical protein